MSKVIGRRIRSFRQNMGMSQEELGRYLGVNKSAVQKYEAGMVNLRADKIRILCRVFKTYPKNFVFESDADYLREIFDLHEPEKLTILESPADARLLENYVSRDILDVVLEASLLNTAGRKALLEHARLLRKVPELSDGGS